LTKKLKKFAALSYVLIFVLASFTSQAQKIVHRSDSSIRNSISDTAGIVADSVPPTTNPMMASDTLIDSISVQDKTIANSSNEDSLDKVYADRVGCLPGNLPWQYNNRVRAFIDLYADYRHDQVVTMLGLSKIYFPVFEKVLSDSGMPQELKYLPIIESALNPMAISYAGAVGLWQFMYGTGALYGLKVNAYCDDRRDIFKATEAAVSYLKALHAAYGDWFMALAAYNCGPGYVNYAMQASGGGTNYWEICHFLPYETQNYVPAFIAASYIMNYYSDHGIDTSNAPYAMDSIVQVPVMDKMTQSEVCKYTGITADELKFLNPGLNSNIIPSLNDGFNYTLKLPADKLNIFSETKDSIVLASRTELAQFYAYSSPYGSGYYRSVTGFVYHRVQYGETLSAIAHAYRVYVSQIRSWNGLGSNFIRAGQLLRIYSGSAPSYSSSSQSTASNSSVIYYRVRSGDTLWGIARKYPGLTIEKLRQLNNAYVVNNLKAGAVLRVN
jgi:membrane-bound lytic murein transglycosylase D